MAFRIEPGEPLPHALKRMAREELADARDAVGTARAPLDERIHEVRTSIKKVRALNRLVRPAAKRRRARKEDRRLRKVARAVSTVRDAEVVLKTFDGLLAAVDARRARGETLAAARDQLAARLRAAYRPFRQDDDGEAERLRARLARARQKVKRWVPDDAGWRVLERGLEADYRRARDAMKRAFRTESGADFHAWRRAVKTHRHQVHALQALAPRRLKPRLTPLDRLGELLGDEHDLTVLDETIRAERSCFPEARDCDHLLTLVARRRQRLRDRARPLGETLFSERPSELRDRLKRDLRSPHGRGRRR